MPRKRKIIAPPNSNISKGKDTSGIGEIIRLGDADVDVGDWAIDVESSSCKKSEENDDRSEENEKRGKKRKQKV